MKRKHNFNGTIIITDPGYIVIDVDAWEKSEYGERLDKI